ncbi:MAG: LemA family protein [archaeon]
MASKKTESKRPWLSTGKIVLFSIIGLVLLSALWIGGTYNSLVSLQEGVNNKWAQVETQYQRRVDLIPNLVATVKGAANFEAGTLEELTRLRSQWQTAGTVDAKVETANQIESAISKLLVITENYPQLTATQNFQSLQDELANTENKVAVERGRFNDALREYNTKVRVFPTNLVAGMFGFGQKNYFESAEGAENAPTVNFG